MLTFFAQTYLDHHSDVIHQEQRKLLFLDKISAKLFKVQEKERGIKASFSDKEDKNSHFKFWRQKREIITASLLTFPLQKQPEERAGSGDGFTIIIIVVDGQQVTMHISIAHQKLHIWDMMNMLQKAIELIEVTRFWPIEREATKLCTKLGRINRKKQDISMTKGPYFLHLYDSAKDHQNV